VGVPLNSIAALSDNASATVKTAVNCTRSHNRTNGKQIKGSDQRHLAARRPVVGAVQDHVTNVRSTTADKNSIKSTAEHGLSVGY
jgi:hypothetical protein